MKDEPYRSPLNLPKSVLLLLLQAVVSAGAVGSMMMASFSVSTCSARCGLPPLGVFYNATVWISIVAFPLSMVIVALRARSGRVSWWAPASASALIAVVALAGVATAAVALAHA